MGGHLLEALFVLCRRHLSRGTDFDELGDDRSDFICDLLLAKGLSGLWGRRAFGTLWVPGFEGFGALGGLGPGLWSYKSLGPLKASRPGDCRGSGSAGGLIEKGVVRPGPPTSDPLNIPHSSRRLQFFFLPLDFESQNLNSQPYTLHATRYRSYTLSHPAFATARPILMPQIKSSHATLHPEPLNPYSSPC